MDQGSINFQSEVSRAISITILLLCLLLRMLLFHDYLYFQYSAIFKPLYKIYAKNLGNLCFSFPPENPGSGFLVYNFMSTLLEDLLTFIN